MRYVDIDLLIKPTGWQERADNALNELRDEIVRAEREAVRAGQDPGSARKEAITKGLKVNARTQIWRDMNFPLSQLSNGKCWYSESKNPMADKNVDHFRPKNRVDEESDHEGYWCSLLTGVTIGMLVSGAINAGLTPATEQAEVSGITFHYVPEALELG